MSVPGGGGRRSEIEKVLSQLGDPDAAIIRFRFGLDDGRLHTLAETEAALGVDRELVREVERATLAKLRLIEPPGPPGDVA